MDIFTAIANDPNVATDFRRISAVLAAPDYLTAAHEKAAPRRFIEDYEPSAFGALEGIGHVGSLRWQEVNEDERADQLADERAERMERE